MPILSGDIKLVASQTMDDVPEGGGAPTATVITDGTSNAIFPDISELDRAGGRVNLRKLHVSVQTQDTDTYLGSNIIVSDPPADPNISVTLFTTGSTFDRRTDAATRIESYLNRGPMWPGILFENHIAGQRSIQLLQDPSTPLPAVGQTLALVQFEGLGNEIAQYIRTTAVESINRTYYDSSGSPFEKAVVTLGISDALRTDLAGNPASKALTLLPGAALVRDTVVADAGTYAGVTPLAVAADLGDFTVQAASIFTQLVPSAQTETPILDVRTNALGTALVPTGAPVVQTLSMGFTTSTAMYVGGAIHPGSLSVVRDGITLTDAGGLLLSAGAEVGQVDYDNAILTLSANVWGTAAGTHTVTFVPAAAPELITDQRAIRITAESRALNYAFVMEDVPTPRSLSVSYLAQGRWYVLRDAGAGKLAGSSSAYGVGTLSYTTGSVQITLGALPDVGSSIIVQSFSQASTVAASNTLLANNASAYVAVNSDGLLSEEKGSKPYARSSVTITWGAFTATDNGAGQLTGDASGSVDYAGGIIRLSPTVLPAPGTLFTVATQVGTGVTAAAVTLPTGTLGATNITPGSVRFTIDAAITYTAPSGYTLTFTQRTATLTVTDNGAGSLQWRNDGVLVPNAGSINYTTGAIIFTGGSIPVADMAGPLLIYAATGTGWSYTTPWASHPGTRTMAFAPSVSITYSNTAGTGNSTGITPAQYLVRTLMVPGYTLKGVGFALGSVRYAQLSDGTLLKDINPLTGGGTPAGNVSATLGAVFISSWPTGAPSLLADWRGLITPPSVGVAAPGAAFSSSFRTASSPLRPASVSVLGTMQDGTVFNVTADVGGKINGTRVKGRVDYQYGLIELYFVNPGGDPAHNVDLGFLQIAGLTTTPADLAMQATLRYNAVAYSYLPLDADLLGIDPVRLPSDGRVPIFRAGGFAVVGHTASISATVANAQTVNCARVRLSRVRVIGFDGVVVNTGYTTDLEAGTVTFTDVTGYSQPVTIEHRIEDMAVVREAQISGALTFTRALTHDYPLGSFVSSALVAGDLKARVSTLFDQTTWTNEWSDAQIGSAATGTFNDVLAPIGVTNKGAVTERWALIFTNTTTYNVTGEHVGVIGTGTINAPCTPANPATSAPYFTIAALGWGLGWSTGNVLRFNTIGAMTPVWVVRTVQQGPSTGIQHSFTLLSRGDVDRP